MIAVGKGVFQAESTMSGGFCAWAYAASLRKKGRWSPGAAGNLLDARGLRTSAPGLQTLLARHLSLVTSSLFSDSGPPTSDSGPFFLR
jgi:hypothetical protein